MITKEIRKVFRDYFAKHGHEIIPSSHLIPHNDPTLMFTNSGMVPFKNYFTGLQAPAYKSAVSVQKCVRAGGKHNDLENVGFTPRHHTFFEMMGNFSFGGYFKEEAIKLAWDLLTEEFGIDKQRLYVTVFHEDTEAAALWKKISALTDDRIIPIYTSDNFWSMGEYGPCGPCSEIFFDHGEHLPGGLPGTEDEGGSRYVEIWNLVFMQYEDKIDGARSLLPKPSIDTGMGLERVAAVLQGTHDNFDIDIFKHLIQKISIITKNYDISVSHRVVADHLRAICFLISDGIMPSNEARGYVLRRIMRRAMRHCHNLGLKEPGLFLMTEALINQMEEEYPEIARAKNLISSVVFAEEERFLKTLENGMKILHDTKSSLKKGDKLDGKIAFKLYDTFGFPVDLTADVLKSDGIEVDMDSFDDLMQNQRDVAKASWRGSDEVLDEDVWFELLENFGPTDFIGYNFTSSSAFITAIVQNGDIVDQPIAGDAVIIFNQTPFYAQSGGQIGDVGDIVCQSGKLAVLDTKKYAGAIFGHKVIIPEDKYINKGDVVTLEVDKGKRDGASKHHSATHILHHVLRDVLGEHVVQKGSFVSYNRLRFDFSHSKALLQDEIDVIEEKINKMILLNSSITIDNMKYDEAITLGAMALFGEKYTSDVRVVSMGESSELCGGTHVKFTGDIGLFKIISEESVASSVRRIEAIVGLEAIEFVSKKIKLLKEAAIEAKSTDEKLPAKIRELVGQNRLLTKSLSDLKLKDYIDNCKIVDILNRRLCILNVDAILPSEQKQLVSLMQSKHSDSILHILFICSGDKVSASISLNKSFANCYNALDIAKIIANEFGVGGGGKADLAQIGGLDIADIVRVQDVIIKYIQENYDAK